MNYAAKAGKVDGDTKDNGCNGIILGGADSVGCVFLPYDGVDGNQKTANKVLKFGPWWNTDSFGAKRSDVDASAYVGKDVTILLVGSYENKKLTVKAYLNGTAVKAWGADEFVIENFNGKLGWATKLAGVKATAKFVESDTALDKTAFDAKAPTTGVKVGPNVGTWKVEGKNYQTTDFAPSKNGNIYILGSSNDFELTVKISGAKEGGIFFCGNDLNKDGKILEADDQYMLIQANGGIRLVTSDRAWGSDGRQWNDMLLFNPGNDEYTLRVVYKAGKLAFYVNDKAEAEKTVEVAKDLQFGSLVGLWSKHNEFTYKDLEFKVNDNTPKTGEATAIVAVIAVLTLAGATIVAKKRH